MFTPPIDADQIIITASLAPIEEQRTPASVTVIDEARVERLGEPLTTGLLRLVPSVAFAQSGAAGTVSEVRIRGAEANHTLLFIDGIRANDPARGEAPRFELLNADIVSRLEVVRGPQSALWGSEAIGGVVAVSGEQPDAQALAAKAEAGSYGFARGSVSASIPGIAGAVALQRSAGIDIFGGGDRDGYRNLAARLRGSVQPVAGLTLGAAGFVLAGRSEFDGYDPVTFARAHDLTSKDRMAAGRLWAELGDDQDAWRAEASVATLGSRTRNAFEGAEINRTLGSRTTFAAQIEHRLSTGPVDHLLIAAAEHERETFEAEDTVYGGASAQDRDRTHDSLTAEWRATGGPVTGDLAMRRDIFNRFKDATSIRASLLVEAGSGFSLAASYGEGIAQPTFFDLYGFFPGDFVGNPTLKPESSRGVEASIRYRSKRLSGALTWYRQRLKDEIVDVFDTFPFTTRNRGDSSRRAGIEGELAWAASESLRFSGHYAYLRASEPGAVAGLRVRETRRPKHSGSLAIDGIRGRLGYGASLAFVGSRADSNFDVFPAEDVRLGSYWMANARLSYRVAAGVELFARGSNLFDESYQDVFGYRTEGRSLYAGVRFGARP